MHAYAISVHSFNKLTEEIKQLGNLSWRPTVAIIFSSPQFPIEQALEIISDRDIDILGCSTSGEIYNDLVVEKTCTVLFMDMPKESFKIVHFPGSGNDYFESGRSLGKVSKESFDHPGILVYVGGIGVDGESVVSGIKSECPGAIPIYGGLASDDFQFDKIASYTREGIYYNGISALIVDTEVIGMGGKSFSGWNELGKIHSITKAEKNVLLEVDHRPALELFNNYFKGVEYKPQLGSEKLFTSPVIYALNIKRKNKSDIMRSVLIYDFDRKALVLAGAVNDGDTFRFCPTPSFDVLELTINDFKALANKIDTPDAIIMNSCVGRQIAFGPMLDDEVKGIYDFWGVPMVGYMAYGEIGNKTESEACEFHNVTCSLAWFNEKRR